MFKDMSDEEFASTIEGEDFNQLTNIYSNKSREIELGDDISREREIFWDPYYKDNGFGLTQGQSKKLLKGDYIYVPYSDLSFIYGNPFIIKSLLSSTIYNCKQILSFFQLFLMR